MSYVSDYFMALRRGEVEKQSNSLTRIKMLNRHFLQITQTRSNMLVSLCEERLCFLLSVPLTSTQTAESVFTHEAAVCVFLIFLSFVLSDGRR